MERCEWLGNLYFHSNLLFSWHVTIEELVQAFQVDICRTITQSLRALESSSATMLAGIVIATVVRIEQSIEIISGRLQTSSHVKGGPSEGIVRLRLEESRPPLRDPISRRPSQGIIRQTNLKFPADAMIRLDGKFA